MLHTLLVNASSDGFREPQETHAPTFELLAVLETMRARVRLVIVTCPHP